MYFCKKKLKENIPCILLINLILISVIQGSLLVYTSELLVAVLSFMGLATRFLLILSWLFSNSLRKSNVLQFISMLLVTIISFLSIHNFTMFDLFFFAIAFKEKYDYKKIINLFFYSTIIGMIMVVLLYFMGYMPEFLIYRSANSRLRMSFGFSHPNICGRMILNLCILYVLKKREKVNFLDMIAIFVAAYWVWMYPNSITSSLIILMLDVSLILIKLYKILFKKEAVSGALLRLTGMIVVPVIFGVIFYLLVNMDSCSILKDISETVYSRFSMGLEAIKRYSINLFGNKITFVTSSQRYFSNSSDSYFVVDCLYILLLVRFGIIATLYYVYQLYLVIIKSIRKKDTYLFMGMILLLLYSVLENGMTVIGTSYMFVAASARWSEENRYE